MTDLIGLDRRLLGLLALALGVLAVVVLRRWPRLAFGVYLAVLAFVPVWAGTTVRVFLEPQVLVGLVVLATVLPGAGRWAVRPIAADVLLALFVLASLAPLAAGRATLSSVFVVLVQWLGAFLVGRLLPGRAGYEWCLRAVALVFTVVAALAVAEYLTGFNPFVLLPGAADQYAVWGPIQERGGVARAEGAFGHSIALGAALSMAVPMTLASSFRLGVRLGMVLLMVAGVVVTFSRIGLVCTVLGIVLSVLVLAEVPSRLRLLLAGSVAVVGVAVLPLVTRVFTAAGDEASNSAAYRGDLLDLVGDMRALGLSSVFHRSVTGDVWFGSFRSIDSALLLQGLTYGWVSLVAVLLLLALATAAVLTRRATAPTVALVAQLPALATVALITQYSTMVFLVGGLAVCAHAVRRSETAAPPAGSAAPAGLAVPTPWG
ncbi:hypothetical protein [Modestobacter sp. SSW1-42]|uniref:hypothetical protein n=1 Tax=Modestobacter sp. SSW1-42 TaxID=596372 RepID=UPI003985789F